MKESVSTRIVMVAGGTGGHVFPALAIANCLRDLGASILWVGGTTGLETHVVPKSGFELVSIPARRLRGMGVRNFFFSLWTLATALAASLRVLHRERPLLVFGMGGFLTGPVGIAAWLLRIPLCIHEQNTVPGIANRALSIFAKQIFTGFPHSFSGKKQRMFVGNPLRSEIYRLPVPRERRLGRRDDALRILVLGGSLGARWLNETMPNTIALLEKRSAVLQVVHQSGAAGHQSTQAAYAKHDIGSAQVVNFIEHMDESYAWADVVICRAGAVTVSELAAVGLASILIPFPHATDDHQFKNARYLEEQGAAFLAPQKDLNAQALAALLERFIQDPLLLLEMADRARKLAMPNATHEIAHYCMEYVHA